MDVLFLTLFVTGVLLALGVIGFCLIGGWQEWEQWNRLTLTPLVQDIDSESIVKKTEED